MYDDNVTKLKLSALKALGLSDADISDIIDGGDVSYKAQPAGITFKATQPLSWIHDFVSYKADGGVPDLSQQINDALDNAQQVLLNLRDAQGDQAVMRALQQLRTVLVRLGQGE